MRIVGAIALASCAILTSIVASQKLVVNMKFWEQFLSFLNNLKTQIRFNASDLQTILQTSQDSDILCKLFKKTQEEMENKTFQQAFVIALKQYEKQLYFSKSDIYFLSDFAKELGVTDVDGQINHINLYITLTSEKLKKAREIKEKNVKLYRMLGTALSAVMFILVI